MVQQVVIDVQHATVWLDGEKIPAGAHESFARNDGFADYGDMMAWWNRAHPQGQFVGFIIRWTR
jgi:hypothetical protein